MSQRPGRRARTAGFIAALLASAVGLTACEESIVATVSNIVDGDTIDVVHDGEERRVRLLNVDTPEATDPDAPPDCLGPEATAYLEDTIPVGTEIRLESDEELQDRYGRYLAGVFVGETLVNAEIARAGLGVAVLFEPNSRFYTEVLAAQEEARAAERGLFDPDIDCTIPAQLAVVSDTEELLESDTLENGSLGELRALESEVAAAIATALALSELLDGDRNSVLIAGLAVPELTAMRDSLTTTSSRLDRKQRDIRQAIEAEEERITTAREASRAAREAERQAAREERERQTAAEEQARQAAHEEQEEQARRAAAEREVPQRQQQSTDSQRNSSPHGNSGSSGSSGNSGSSGYDGYTGCRDYGTALPPNASDEQGRPYTKIDCTTKLPIG